MVTKKAFIQDDDSVSSSSSSESDYDDDDSNVDMKSDDDPASESGNDNDDNNPPPSNLSMFQVLLNENRKLDTQGVKGLRRQNALNKNNEKEKFDDSKGNGKDGSYNDKMKSKYDRKHAPVEISAKRPVSRFQVVVPLKRDRFRDPRFDSLAGSFNEKLFRENYGFLDEYRRDELKKVKELLKSVEKQIGGKPKKGKPVKKSVSEMSEAELVANDLRKRAQSLQSSLLENARTNAVRDRQEARHSEEKKAVRSGKRPFYVKKSERKKLNLEDQYAALASAKGGKMEKYLKRKSKKLVAKDRRKLPLLAGEE